MLLVFLAALAGAEPLVLNVPTDVGEVIVDCGGATKNRYPVMNGHATISPALRNDCKIIFAKKVAVLSGGGAYNCTMNGCTKASAPKIDTKPGEVAVRLDASSRATAMEITCDGGYRQRTVVADGGSTFQGVPDGGCTLNFKGGAPAKFRPITPGAWDCHFEGTVAVCKKL